MRVTVVVSVLVCVCFYQCLRMLQVYHWVYIACAAHDPIARDGGQEGRTMSEDMKDG